MSGADDDLPEWAQPLVRGPIEVNGNTDAGELGHELAERLEALLQFYGCEANADGWRRLALHLALDHRIAGQPVMRVVTPVDRRPEAGGAEPGRRWWLAMRMRKRARELGSIKAAAKELSKTTGLSVGRLQNLAADAAAGRLAKPREMERRPWEDWISATMEAAADQLEGNHEIDRLLS